MKICIQPVITVQEDWLISITTIYLQGEQSDFPKRDQSVIRATWPGGERGLLSRGSVYVPMIRWRSRTEMDVMWWNHHDTGVLSMINRRETSVRENKGSTADRRCDQTCAHAADYYATGEEIEMRVRRRLTILTLASSSGGRGLELCILRFCLSLWREVMELIHRGDVSMAAEMLKRDWGRTTEWTRATGATRVRAETTYWGRRVRPSPVRHIPDPAWLSLTKNV